MHALSLCYPAKGTPLICVNPAFGRLRHPQRWRIRAANAAAFIPTRMDYQELIFDPQGEYANVNEQDQTGLRLLVARV